MSLESEIDLPIETFLFPELNLILKGEMFADLIFKEKMTAVS